MTIFPHHKYRVMSSVLLTFLLLSGHWNGAQAGGGEPGRPGDLLGRDLDLPGYGSYGHVGLWTGSHVLECLGESPPIHKRSLDSFKDITTYWGARYLPRKRKYRQVIHAGWEQRSFRPRFTLSPVYREGRFTQKKIWNRQTQSWERRTVMIRAKFRCDTFVSYAYKVGIGYKVPQSGTVPGLMYQAFGEPR